MQWFHLVCQFLSLHKWLQPYNHKHLSVTANKISCQSLAALKDLNATSNSKPYIWSPYSKHVSWFLLHFEHLSIYYLSLTFIYSRQDLHSLHILLWSPSGRLSPRLDRELTKNLSLPISFTLHVTVGPFSSSASIGIENVMYCSVFFPMHSNCPLGFSPCIHFSTFLPCSGISL